MGGSLPTSPDMTSPPFPMAHHITVVISQGQSHHPAKRKLEEDLVSQLLLESGVELAVIPHLYDLTADGSGMLCLQGLTGDIIVLSWMYPRAARWILNRNKIQGQEGATLLVEEVDPDEEEAEEVDQNSEPMPRVIDSLEIPKRRIYCLDLRVRKLADDYLQEIRRIVEETKITTIEPTDWLKGQPAAEHVRRLIEPLPGNVESRDATVASRANNGLPTQETAVIEEETARRWYPVIDMSRCTNCMECIDFCLFGVYGVDQADTILVEQPDNCRKGCPACSRVCPENAIIFPQHKSPAIAGSAEVLENLKIDLSKLFGAPEADAVDVAVRERDEQLMLVGRDAVGHDVGLERRQPERENTKKDALDQLIEQLDEFDL